MYLAYSLLTLALFVVVSPYFLYQAIRYRKYIGTLRQRLGFLPITFNIDAEESIWIHAVSVGEALTARALLADLRERELVSIHRPRPERLTDIRLLREVADGLRRL